MTSASLAGFAYLFAEGDGRGLAPLLLLHKTGGDERQLLPFAARVAPGRPVLAVRGPVVEDGRHRFFRRLSPGVFDEADVARRAGELARFVAEARALHGLPKPVALGLSNGANIAAALLLLHPESLAGAVLLRPAPPFAAPPEASIPATPVLIVAGDADAVVPRADTDRLAAELAARGTNVSIETIAATHEPSPLDEAAAEGWLAALDVNA